MSQQSLPFDEQQPGKTCLPVFKNLAESSSELILKQFIDKLPDLSKVHVLLPANSAAPVFRSTLLTKASELGYPALLGPHIASLENWAKQHSYTNLRVISEHTRELLLVGALKEFPDIYQHSSPWTLAESLMELFDELTIARIELPSDIEDFQQQICKAYGATEEINATLGKEALLVHSLWYAMHKQLSELDCIDRTSASLLYLSSSIKNVEDDQRLFFCGIDNPSPTETLWRKQLLTNRQLSLVVHDYKQIKTDSSDPYFQFLDLVYDTEAASFFERSETCKKLFPESPAQSKIRVFAAEGSEDEALGIDIQVRRWLLEGKTNIGIVTENRKLARRVRALLERANVKVADDAGWALSTTSAATVLERWLETIEQDFHYLPLLDFLKSPFVLSNEEEFLKIVYQLEKHIVIDENTPGDINRYLHHIEIRKTKLEEGHIQVNYDGMIELLNTVSSAARELVALQQSKQEHDGSEFITALLDSLKLLNITDTFSTDEAGIQLLSEINELKLAVAQMPVKMNWVAFRSWLGRTFERFNFKPETIASPVKLTTLSGSEYFKFDACIIAGAEQNFLPHSSKVSPFFNDAVRIALNIPTRNEHQALSHFLFRRLLCTVEQVDSKAANILITRRAMDNGEEIIASPWIAALQAFHNQCYGSDLSDSEIPALIADSNNLVILDNAELPTTITKHPKTQIPASLIPATISASAYQQLVDCPYQFFAARCLQLAPPEIVREALQKLDYGNRVHRCLEAFHSDIEELPGPFEEKITRDNQQQAVELMNEIAFAVFSRDIEDNFLHRGWLKRWQQTIPLYIEWQIEQQKLFTPIAHEIEIKKAPLADNLMIKGRIDRIDSQQNGIAVLDYKTGRTARKQEIIDGEEIQLPFYLLLLISEDNPKFSRYLKQSDDLISAFYVDLYNNKKVTAKSTIENQELFDAVDKNRHRLIAVMDQLKQGYEAPAWGSVDVCQYCKMDVLCRKQIWVDN